MSITIIGKQMLGVAVIPGATLEYPIGIAIDMYAIQFSGRQPPFPDVTGHIHRSIRTLSLRITAHAGWASNTISIITVPFTQLISERILPVLVTQRRALPFLFGWQADVPGIQVRNI